MIKSEIFLYRTLFFGPESRISPAAKKAFSFNGKKYSSFLDFLKKNPRHTHSDLISSQKSRLLNHPELLDFLKSFPEIKHFSYCDQKDLYLGNGLSISSPDVIHPDKYLGNNIFGMSLLNAYNEILSTNRD